MMRCYLDVKNDSNATVMRSFRNIIERVWRRLEVRLGKCRSDMHTVIGGINPKDVIGKLTVEELSLTSDKYFRSIADTTGVMSKPFSDLIETPQILENIGLLLSGLHLGKSMKVLEFGAGSCWLSRYLSQLQCQTICCDVSRTALDIGRRLFEEFPIVGASVSEPVFLHFDGHNINLPDESVDRIVCSDAFHHVPNQKEVLSELARVLKVGGIAGFAEPGRFHSQSPQSQFEMRNFQVLENDIIPSELFSIALDSGFDDMRLKVFCDMDVSASEYEMLTNGTPATRLSKSLRDNLRRAMLNRTVFFLYKGKVVLDSRSHEGLSHSITTSRSEFHIKAGEYLNIQMNITNTGGAKWITKNINDIGVVKIGTHLYDEHDKLITLDFSRHCFTTPIESHETVERTITISFSDVGVYKLAIDLVAERICWFENIGSKPQSIKVTVQP